MKDFDGLNNISYTSYCYIHKFPTYQTSQ